MFLRYNYRCFTGVYWVFTMKTIINHALTGIQGSLIAKVERFQGAFEATKFQRPALIESLKKSSIITSSGASTRIEGAMLADEQVKDQPIYLYND